MGQKMEVLTWQSLLSRHVKQTSGMRNQQIVPSAGEVEALVDLAAGLSDQPGNYLIKGT